ncbi:MAG: hypothetical protein V4642_03600 [Bacteroidota bacterium]
MRRYDEREEERTLYVKDAEERERCNKFFAILFRGLHGFKNFKIIIITDRSREIYEYPPPYNERHLPGDDWAHLPIAGEYKVRLLPYRFIESIERIEQKEQQTLEFIVTCKKGSKYVIFNWETCKKEFYELM